MDTVNNLLEESSLADKSLGVTRSFNVVIFKHLYNNSLCLADLEVGKEYTLVYLIFENERSRATLNDARKLGDFYLFDNVTFIEQSGDLFYFDRMTSSGSPYRHFPAKSKYKAGWWVLSLDT